MSMKIYYLSSFERLYKKLPKNVKEEAKAKEKLFRQNPFDPKLGTHKLHGPLSDYWAFWVNNRDRVIFEFGDKNEIWFYKIGDHSIYE
ncbi:MAG: type II toxin-antitoxin system mRNA interferase toxin, RelE/StbE family [Patescibacteria group bacterium]